MLRQLYIFDRVAYVNISSVSKIKLWSKQLKYKKTLWGITW